MGIDTYDNDSENQPQLWRHLSIEYDDDEWDKKNVNLPKRNAWNPEVRNMGNLNRDGNRQYIEILREYDDNRHQQEDNKHPSSLKLDKNNMRGRLENLGERMDQLAQTLAAKRGGNYRLISTGAMWHAHPVADIAGGQQKALGDNIRNDENSKDRYIRGAQVNGVGGNVRKDGNTNKVGSNGDEYFKMQVEYKQIHIGVLKERDGLNERGRKRLTSDIHKYQNNDRDSDDSNGQVFGEINKNGNIDGKIYGNGKNGQVKGYIANSRKYGGKLYGNEHIYDNINTNRNNDDNRYVGDSIGHVFGDINKNRNYGGKTIGGEMNRQVFGDINKNRNAGRKRYVNDMNARGYDRITKNRNTDRKEYGNDRNARGYDSINKNRNTSRKGYGNDRNARGYDSITKNRNNFRNRIVEQKNGQVFGDITKNRYGKDRNGQLYGSITKNGNNGGNIYGDSRKGQPYDASHININNGRNIYGNDRIGQVFGDINENGNNGGKETIEDMNGNVDGKITRKKKNGRKRYVDKMNGQAFDDILIDRTNGKIYVNDGNGQVYGKITKNNNNGRKQTGKVRKGQVSGDITNTNNNDRKIYGNDRVGQGFGIITKNENNGGQRYKRNGRQVDNNNIYNRGPIKIREQQNDRMLSKFLQNVPLIKGVKQRIQLNPIMTNSHRNKGVKGINMKYPIQISTDNQEDVNAGWKVQPRRANPLVAQQSRQVVQKYRSRKQQAGLDKPFIQLNKTRTLINTYNLTVVTQGTSNQASLNLKYCSPKLNVFYLKISKTASYTVATIVYWLAWKHNLSILPVTQDSYVSVSPELSNTILSQVMRPPDGSNVNPPFDILSDHVKYMPHDVNYLFSKNANHIVTLQSPFSQFLSYFNENNLKAWFGINGKDGAIEFLNNYDYYLDKMLHEKKSSTFVRNTMARYFGMNDKTFRNRTALVTTINRISQKFQNVIIFESFDESLILLRRNMCWKTKDIIYLAQQERNYQAAMTMDDYKGREAHKKLSPIDYSIYNTMLGTFLRTLSAVPDDFWEELKQFQLIEKAVKTFCIDILRKLGESPESIHEFVNRNIHLNISSEPWGGHFQISAVDCAWMNMDLRVMSNVLVVRQWPQLCASTIITRIQPEHLFSPIRWVQENVVEIHQVYCSPWEPKFGLPLQLLATREAYT